MVRIQSQSNIKHRMSIFKILLFSTLICSFSSGLQIKKWCHFQGPGPKFKVLYHWPLTFFTPYVPSIRKSCWLYHQKYLNPTSGLSTFHCYHPSPSYHLTQRIKRKAEEDVDDTTPPPKGKEERKAQREEEQPDKTGTLTSKERRREAWQQPI